jgi:5-methyltetrahydropteroyltriglutamate--homocysteine methyltransferase
MYIRTSHVGSFPLPYSLENISKIIDDLWGIGLSAPPYPQLRSFISIYLDPLVDEGILERKGDFYFLNDREKLKMLEHYKPSIPDARYSIEYIRSKNYGFKWLRGPVTGVFTLASRIYLEKDISKGLSATLLREKDLLRYYIVTYVHENLDLLSKLGYNILFVDEPVLGVIVGKRRILFNYNQGDIVNVLNTVFENIPGEHGIHVCGRISPRLFKILTETDKLNILNFEFYDNLQNINSIDPEALLSSGKKLAPGIASSKKPRVESVDELKNLLVRIGEMVDWRIDLVSADCGFGGLASESGDPYEAYSIGLEKLRNIVFVVNEVSKQNT